MENQHDVKRRWGLFVEKYFEGGNAKGRDTSIITDLRDIYEILKEVEEDK